MRFPNNNSLENYTTWKRPLCTYCVSVICNKTLEKIQKGFQINSSSKFISDNSNKTRWELAIDMRQQGQLGFKPSQPETTKLRLFACFKIYWTFLWYFKGWFSPWTFEIHTPYILILMTCVTPCWFPHYTINYYIFPPVLSRSPKLV